MTSSLKSWLVTLWITFSTGCYHAGAVYLGLLVAHDFNKDIPALNLEGLGVAMLASGCLKLLMKLEINPLPGVNIEQSKDPNEKQNPPPSNP